MSCALSEVMGNNGKLVTVEADPDVWAMHQVGETEFTVKKPCSASGNFKSLFVNFFVLDV